MQIFVTPFFCQVLQVPNLETGKFEPLITGDDNGALTKDEEMQFRNMVMFVCCSFNARKVLNIFIYGIIVRVL